MKYIPLLKYLPFLLFVLNANTVNSQTASISGIDNYEKEPAKSWPEVVGCFDLDSFSIGKVEQNGKIYLVLNKKIGPNQWALASPNIFPSELLNKYLKYSVVTNEDNIYESQYWEPLGTLTEEFIQTYTADRAWGHEIIGMNPSEVITNVKFYFYSNISNCTLSEFYCLTDWAPDYDVFELNVNNLNYFLCGVPTNLMCPVVGNIKGNLSGNDLILTAPNINNSQFLNLANQALVYELGIEIKGYNGSANETRFINIPINSSFNIEQWQETLTDFGVYSEYRVTLFYKIFDTVEFVSCEEEIQLPVSTSTELCEILNLLKHTKNGDTLSWSFIDIENPQYFSDALSNLGISAAQAQNFYQNVDAIDFDLEYSENGGQNQSLSIHHVVGNDSLASLLIQFAPLNFQQLNGTLKTTYYYNNDGIEECSTLPFEYLIENPGNGTLKEYECGKNYNISTGNGNENIILHIGDVFEVNGLTCQIKTVSNSAPYSGTGIISHPFTKKRLKVTFEGVVVDSTYVMTSGTVLGIRATPGSFPNFLISPDTISINGDICMVTPKSEEFDDDGFSKLTGLNARGFNKQGIHHKTNTAYDERGFDINGVHKNGKIYDDFGCNVEGLDSLGMPCEPSISEDDLKSFIDSNLVFIDSVSLSQLNGLIDKWQDSLQALNCSTDSLALIALINSSQAINSNNRQYVEGQHKEYISPQMSNLFSEEPKVITQDNTRDQIIKKIEQKHIDLYRCDKERVRYIKMLERLNGYTEIEIKSYIKSKLVELTPFQVDQFKKDKAALIDWIIVILSDLIAPEMGIGSITPQKELHHDLPIITQKNRSQYYSMASVNIGSPLSISDEDEKKKIIGYLTKVLQI
ncbi:MAG: hypothetical protein IPP37_10975 [Saprospiraceae bacterium]|nr:hypothetical protein [Saprospiraceae bacterium]